MENLQLQAFFSQHPIERQLFDEFLSWMIKIYPHTQLRIMKTQINLLDPTSYAIISLPYRKVKSRAFPHLILTLGMGTPIENERAFYCTKIHEHRWTCHLLVQDKKNFDEQLLKWIQEARIYTGLESE